MTTPIEVFPSLAVIAATFVIAAAAVFIAHRHRRRLVETWREFAERHRYEFAERVGPWFRRRGPVVTGSIDGVDFTLERVVRSHGHGHSSHTRVSATLDPALDTMLVVFPNTWNNRLEARFGAPVVDMGSPSFDERLIVRSKEARVAHELIDGDVRDRLLALGRRARLVCDEHEARLEWHGTERDPARLEAACDLIGAVCKRRSSSGGVRATAVSSARGFARRGESRAGSSPRPATRLYRPCGITSSCRSLNELTTKRTSTQ